MIPLGVLASGYVAPAGGVPTSGLVLYLDGEDFTNNPQTTTWADRSDAGNDGTASHFAYTTSSGSTGTTNCVRFDGTNDIVNCGTGFSISSALTMCLWVSHAWSNTYARALVKEGDWGIVLNAYDNAIRWYGSGTDLKIGSAALSSAYYGTYDFVCVTYSSADMIRCYVNGTAAGTLSKTGNLTNGAAPVTLGNRVAGDRPLNGGIGAALIYNRVLSSDEMSAIQSATDRS